MKGVLDFQGRGSGIVGTPSVFDSMFTNGWTLSMSALGWAFGAGGKHIDALSTAMARLLSMVAEKKVKIPSLEVVPMDGTQEAYVRLSKRHVTGKIVIKME
ncbi:hypothetical protein ADUPG1_011018 [Aduncisulcus paluster]|uniref:Uncharacterized protein n=1 Tax=Aduncisulcus paluster TaxID=2918883 RepID=A0ABQ5JXD3_9EUKA|nr:hypothetical protein ADUPG1_011018 [Aduncisulcus paluster]